MLGHKTSLRIGQLTLLFAAIGLSCLGAALFVVARAGAADRASRTIDPSVPGNAASIPSTVEHGPTADARDQTPVMGRLEIPSLKLSVPILSNDDSSSLLKGVGHIPGTALPGGLGNVGLAGHRDMYLRPLKAIAPKMDVRIVSGNGTYHYEVDSTEIVTPDQVRVLDVNSRPELTLVTCYPFYYVGNAPKRFIVHAHLISALPDTAE